MSLHDEIQADGQAATEFVEAKTVFVNATTSLSVRVRDVDAVTVEMLFGDDPREFVCLHGLKPVPTLSQGQVVTVDGCRLKVVKPPLDSPGSAFWECYAVRIVPGKDS